jgi:hypothetical protein
MRAAIEEAVRNLTTLRKCRRIDALHSVAASFRENVHDSADTSMQGYWQLMLECADGLIASEIRVSA